MTEEITSKLKLPAIGLIVTGILNVLWGILEIGSNAFMYSSKSGIYATNQSTEFNFGIVIGLAIVIISMLVAPFLIWGGLQMYRGKNYKFSKISAILALIPVASCCFVIGIPLGIWALVILSKPEVKAAFEGAPSNPFNPPPPPTF